MLGQSFDTIESSYVGVDEGSSLLDGARLDNALMLDNATEDTTGVVSDEDIQDDPNEQDNEGLDALMDTGILIIPPGTSTASNYPITMCTEEDSDNNNQNPALSPMNLSIPDSVPSNVASLVLPEPSLAGPIATNTTTSTTIAHQEQKQVVRALQYAVAFLMIIGAFGLPTIYLVRERNELRSTTLRLEEQIRILQKEVDSEKTQSTLRLREQIRVLQDEIIRASKPKAAGTRTSKDGPTFSWEQAAYALGGSGGTNSHRIDNCWLRADANVELGECAVQTKKTVKKKLKKMGTKIGQELWRAQEVFFVKMESMKQQYFASNLYHAVSEIQEKNVTSMSGEESTKRKLKTFGKAAASVLSGVAFASAATLIASGAFLDRFGGGSDDNSRNC